SARVSDPAAPRPKVSPSTSPPLLITALCPLSSATKGREGPRGAARGRNRAAIQGHNLSHLAARTYGNCGLHLPDTPYSRLRRPPFRVSENFHPSTSTPTSTTTPILLTPVGVVVWRH